MKRLGRILLFAAMLAVSAGAMLFLLPGLKEGFSREQIPFLLGGALLFVALGAVWWLACGRSARRSAIGWVVLALPCLAYMATAGSLIAAYLEGRRLAENVRIEGFSETPIHWPGFDGPVGVTLRFELVHPKAVTALILPPEIRMGPALDIPSGDLSATHTGGSGYFKDTYLDAPVGDLTLLKTVLFQRHYRNDRFEREAERWLSAAYFDDGGRTRLTYHLHPGSVDFLARPSRLCLASESFGIAPCAEGQDATTGCAPRHRRAAAPIYHVGGDLTALWMAAGRADLAADLSPVLTEALRAGSGLQDRPQAWTAIQKRLEPDGLVSAGYRLCPPGGDSHTAFRTCYCRDPAG